MDHVEVGEKLWSGTNFSGCPGYVSCCCDNTMTKSNQGEERVYVPG